MSTILTEGMEPALVGQHAQALTAHAETVRSTATRAKQILTTLAWRGPDRDQFVGRASSSISKELDRVAAALAQRAKRLDTEVARQVEASTK